MLDDNITVRKDMSMKTENGDITIGKTITADKGSVAMTTGKGDISVGEDIVAGANVTMTVGMGNIEVGSLGRGNVTAGNNVTMSVEEGSVSIVETVTAGEDGKVDILTKKGNIKIGNNGPYTPTVTAGQDVTLETGNGEIRVQGMTSAIKGSVTLRAASDAYQAGEAGHNIIIEQDGMIEAGRDAMLETKNGDIHVTDRIVAGHSISAITHEQGDIFLDREVDASRDRNGNPTDGSVILRADKGNITASIDPVTNSRYKITAGNAIEAITGEGDITVGIAEAGQDISMTAGNGNITVDTAQAGNNINASTRKGNITMETVRAGNSFDAYAGDGNIAIGEAEAKRMSLVARGEDGHVTADRLLVHANGTGDVTGAANLTLGGSQVNVTQIENDGAAPLIISTVGGAAENRPMQDFNIGVRVGDGTYTGGIRSASGTVIQQLWADRGMIYMAGNSNLHMNKLVVNEKLHVANDIVSVGIYGVPPYHDGARVVYWNDAGKKNPSGMLDRWYNGSYIDPMWMYLDLDGSGAVGSRYGVLMDAHYYRNLHGDSVSMVDTMRIRMEPIPADNGIYYFDRNNLIEIDDSGLDSDDSPSEAEPEEITVELNYRNNVAGI